jgi:hypothetical protein
VKWQGAGREGSEWERKERKRDKGRRVRRTKREGYEQEGAGSREEWGGMAITHNLFHHSDA